MRVVVDGIEMLVDVRPYVKSRFDENLAFYNGDTMSVLKKVVRSQSFARVNEAVFNKFGFGFFTQKYSAFVQAVAKDCIRLDRNSRLQRTRLTDQDLQKISADLRSVFSSFTSNLSPNTLDGQHIMGAGDLLEHPAIKKMINRGRLAILGSPTSLTLNCRHHTKMLIDDIPNRVM
jgi:hypothetical protein